MPWIRASAAWHKDEFNVSSKENKSKIEGSLNLPSGGFLFIEYNLDDKCACKCSKP